MDAYQTDHAGVFVGVVVCDESPLEPGVFLIPFGAVQVAPPAYEDGQLARWDGSIWHIENIDWAQPDPDPDPTWDTVRAERDFLLAKSDWTQLADAPLTASEKQAWAVYRQALRDIPQDFDSPELVVWPTAP